MKHGQRHRCSKGAVLVIVLWVVIMLSVILVNMGYSVRTETMITANYVTEHDLRQIANSGIECGIAVLKQDTLAGDHSAEIWSDNEDLFREHSIHGGIFSLVRYELDGGELVERFGLEDEASKLNLRTADRERLQKLGGLTDEQISALLDWQDGDGEAQNLGAESDYYAQLPKLHLAKNAGLRTLEELLLVRGFDAMTLYGEDWNQNGKLDSAENDGDRNPPDDDEDGELDLGILAYVTVWSTEANQTKSDTPRVNLNSANEETLKKEIPGLSDDEARSIVAHRDKNKFETVGQLLNVEEAPPQNQDGEDKKDANENKQEQKQDGNSPKNGQEQQSSGKKIISRDRLKQIIDYCRIDDDEQKPGRININTAPARVLATITGIDRSVAEEIVRSRKEERKVFQNVAELMDVAGLSEENFIKLTELVTVRSDQFTIRSEARMQSVKGRKRLVAVVDRSGGEVKTLYWNEQ